jgi:hypothetical protein
MYLIKGLSPVYIVTKLNNKKTSNVVKNRERISTGTSHKNLDKWLTSTRKVTSNIVMQIKIIMRCHYALM